MTKRFSSTKVDLLGHIIDQELVVKIMTHKLPSRGFQDLLFASTLIKNYWSAGLDWPRFRILEPLIVGYKSLFRHP